MNSLVTKCFGCGQAAICSTDHHIEKLVASLIHVDFATYYARNINVEILFAQVNIIAAISHHTYQKTYSFQWPIHKKIYSFSCCSRLFCPSCAIICEGGAIRSSPREIFYYFCHYHAAYIIQYSGNFSAHFLHQPQSIWRVSPPSPHLSGLAIVRSFTTCQCFIKCFIK